MTPTIHHSPDCGCGQCLGYVARIEELEAALRAYGRHLFAACESSVYSGSGGVLTCEKRPCACGLAAALGEP